MAEQKTPQKRTKIIDVARKSGFAASTVSVVLNGAPVAQRVPAATQECIKKAAKELGYRPDTFARSLRSRRTQTIGLIIFDISDPFCSAALDCIESALDHTSYLPVIMDARGDKIKFERYLSLLLDRRVEGLIVVATWLLGKPPLLLEVRNELPIVMVGRDFSSDGIFSITVDNVAGGYRAIQHLYEVGHRQIAVIRGPQKMADGNLRWEGVQQFTEEYSLRIAPDCIRQLPCLSTAKSAFKYGDQITRELLQASACFTALVAFDDLTALGAMRALSSAGLSIPQNCSVIGFDDVLLAEVSTPGLTTIRQPLEKIGSLAAEYIVHALQENKGNDAGPLSLLRVLSPSLIKRDSTRPIPVTPRPSRKVPQ